LDIDGMEDNEWSFCSLWAKKIELLPCGRALANEKLQGDYFFNRAAVEGCAAGAELQVARKFWARGMDCYLYFRFPSNLPHLDTMHVLVSRRAKKSRGNVVQIGRQDLVKWVDVFCRSFGVPQWRSEVERIMEANFEKLELLLSYRGDVPAACAALYRKSGLAGLYCLGTLSRYRREGLAGSILAFAQRTTKSDGTPLFLQTLESEGLVHLYKKSGFVLSHKKQVCVIKKPD
jgi:GNAT superfamily N-acetyltransferase